MKFVSKFCARNCFEKDIAASRIFPRMNDNGKNFEKRWLKIFALEKFSAKAVREHTARLPLPDPRDFCLCEFLFRELPKLFPKTSNASFVKTAEAYARFCFAFWQSKNAFVPFPQDYACFLKKALRGETPLLDGGVCAIAELAGTPDKSGACGFNTFTYRDVGLLRAAARLARGGAYEEFLSPSGLAKYREFESLLENSDEFSRDWEMLKALYPDYKELGRPFVLHRRAVLERGWSRGAGTRFDSPENLFRAAFELFCWKYYLWGMDLVEDSPLLLKPSVNVTPLGTQIFIPGYMSYDSRRDFDHAKIARIHRARGVRRQGSAFSSSRIENGKLADEARKYRDEGRKSGLRGNALSDFVAEKISRPRIDRRTLRRMLKNP